MTAAAASSGAFAPLLGVDLRLLVDPRAALWHAGAIKAAFANPGTWIALLGWAAAAAAGAGASENPASSGIR